MQNIISFVNVLVAAQRNKVEKIVYASSLQSMASLQKFLCKKLQLKISFRPMV
jgi:nucleoside-diphosphate-sugar epimerase